MYNPRAVFDFLCDAEALGEQAVLATITAVTGGASRNPGAHMAVAADGRYAGSFSGGCVEAAVVAEALTIMNDDRPRMLRIGEGSPYIDLRLPCGGSIDLLFNPLRGQKLGQRLASLLDARKPLRLRLPTGEGRVELSDGVARFGVNFEAGQVTVNHIPPLRLALIGHGATMFALARLGAAADCDLSIASPDPEVLAGVPPRSKPSLLKTADLPADFESDAWTAAVVLFHDHDWEPRILASLLDGPAYYVGAMGSYQTHERRTEMLRAIGVGEEKIARIVAPIGLIPSMRDPETLAVSILAQVVERYNRLFLDSAA